MFSPRTTDTLFIVFNTLASILIGAGVFVALPARYWPVDVGGAVVLVAFTVASARLLRPENGALKKPAALAMGAIAVLGGLTVLALFFSAGHLYGIYGPVGRGGAFIFLFVVALVVPYLVIFPLLEFFWLRRRPF